MTSCKKCGRYLAHLIQKFCGLADKISFILNFITRLYLADTFFNSGLAKIYNWNSTLFIFQYEYGVPILNFKVAAYLATIVELSCPVLLVLGLGTRFAALFLLCVSAVVSYATIEAVEAPYWFLLFSLLIAYGGDKLSLDYWIKKKWSKTTTHKNKK